MIIVDFLDTVVTVDVLTASNNDVMLVHWTKKLDFHKFAPCKYVTKLLKPRSKSARMVNAHFA